MKSRKSVLEKAGLADRLHSPATEEAFIITDPLLTGVFSASEAEKVFEKPALGAGILFAYAAAYSIKKHDGYPAFVDIQMTFDRGNKPQENKGEKL